MSDKQYRIIQLTSENVKRLKAVSISPKGNVVEISGENENGKSSVLDSIYYALGGNKIIPDRPIRVGEEKAVAIVKLNGLTVRRTFNRQEDGSFTTAVIVESDEGMRASKPQDMLNKLIGELTFDPLEFKDMSEKKQFEILKSFVPGFSFEQAAIDRKNLFDARAEVNRNIKSARMQADAIVIDEDSPSEAVDVSKLMDDLDEISDKNQEIRQAEARKANLTAEAERLEDDSDRHLTKARSIREEADKLIAEQETLAATAHKEAASVRETIEKIGEIPDFLDTNEIREQIKSAQDVNNLVNLRIRKRDLIDSADKSEEEADVITAKINAIEHSKRKAIETAKIPVDGLGFGDEQILLNGLPFNQASSAQQIRASMALAIAANPRLRVILIRQGSLLDKKAFKILEEMAETHDFQVWVEVVESSRDGAIIIEDGQVKDIVDASE